MRLAYAPDIASFMSTQPFDAIGATGLAQAAKSQAQFYDDMADAHTAGMQGTAYITGKKALAGARNQIANDSFMPTLMSGFASAIPSFGPGEISNLFNKTSTDGLANPTPGFNYGNTTPSGIKSGSTLDWFPGIEPQIVY